MTFDDIWKQLCNKRPALKDGNTVLEFTSDNLRTLLEQVYDKGVSSVPKQSNNFDIFGSIFNKGK